MHLLLHFGLDPLCFPGADAPDPRFSTVRAARTVPDPDRDVSSISGFESDTDDDRVGSGGRLGRIAGLSHPNSAAGPDGPRTCPGDDRRARTRVTETTSHEAGGSISKRDHDLRSCRVANPSPAAGPPWCPRRCRDRRGDRSPSRAGSPVDAPLGLLLNSMSAWMEDGIERIVQMR